MYWQAGLTQASVRWRAALVIWHAHARRLRARLARDRHRLTSAALVLAGMAGALGGGAVVGRWCLGLVMIAEAGGLIWLGLMRDDGRPAPLRGARTVAQILDDERLRQ